MDEWSDHLRKKIGEIEPNSNNIAVALALSHADSRNRESIPYFATWMDFARTLNKLSAMLPTMWLYALPQKISIHHPVNR